MLRFKDFLLESKEIYDGNFTVTDYMITNGKFNIKLPEIVTGDFITSYNDLTSLEGSPKEIGGSFLCNGTTISNLTSLKGGPIKVGKNFKVNGNKISNLIGSPESVGQDIECSFTNLTSLEGAPLKIGGTIYTDEVEFDLSVEKTFVLKKNYFNKDTYWLDLLKYMIKDEIKLDKVKGWPKGFINPELIQSIKRITKFNL